MKSGVILLGHGSRAEGGNEELIEMAGMVAKKTGITVNAAFLQFYSPSLSEAVDGLAAAGAGDIVVVPYFLFSGNHVTVDIPGELDALRSKHPGVKITLTAHLGAHELLSEIVIERIKANG